MNLCTACGLDFSSVGAFDRHRVGRFVPDERRCLTGEEMLTKGMRQNGRGQWEIAAQADRGRRMRPPSDEEE